ncbi:MAG: anti-sigma factor [Cyanobacteria bacterium J06627_32]
MTASKPTEEQQLLIAGYVLGHLDADEAAAFSQQIAAHPMLQQEVQRLQNSLETGFAPTDIPPPPHLRTELLSRARAQTRIESRPVALQATTSLPTWVKGLGAIAALMIAGLSLSNFFLWRSAQRLRLALAWQPTLQIALEPTQTNLQASATISVDPNRLQATLAVENLPPLPADKVYVLWTVLEADAVYTTDDKNAILTEVFTVNDQAQMPEQILVPRAFRDAGIVKAVAITVEDAEAPQRHESAPILIKQF